MTLHDYILSEAIDADTRLYPMAYYQFLELQEDLRKECNIETALISSEKGFWEVRIVRVASSEAFLFHLVDGTTKIVTFIELNRYELMGDEFRKWCLHWGFGAANAQDTLLAAYDRADPEVAQVKNQALSQAPTDPQALIDEVDLI